LKLTYLFVQVPAFSM